VTRRPERSIEEGHTIPPCWICGGKLDVLTDGEGRTRTICPPCLSRLTGLEEVAQRAAELGTFAQQARLAKPIGPWQKKCAVCAVPIPTRFTYCDICRGPMVRELRRDYMNDYRQRTKKNRKQCEALTQRGSRCGRHPSGEMVNDRRICRIHARLERAGRARYA